tara:strand:+ start:4313 stop:5023 length:711 start_codon:yes stop_codon:yes gene_type:complete
MAIVPTNLRLFGEYLLGKDETITEKDFLPEELSEMQRLIDNQDKENIQKEEKFRMGLLAQREIAKKPFNKNNNLIRDKNTGALVPKYSEEEHNKIMQANIDKAEKQYNSYSKTKGRTSVTYNDEKNPNGKPLINAVFKSFTSPAYNIETTLGHFVAHKNEDGTVTIKDKYDFINNGFDNTTEVPLSFFLKSLPLIITEPEAFGSLLSRFLLPNRARDVNINLDARAKSANTFKEAL